MVGNHVADLVSRYGEHSGAVPEALTDYIKAREGYDYSHHGRAGNPRHGLRARRDRRPVLPARPGRGAHREAAELRELGVDQFAVYDMHDAQEATIDAYGRR